MHNALKHRVAVRSICRDIRPQMGFSLIELMVSITLGMIVLAGLAGIYANTSTARTELERRSQQIDNARYAVEVLSEDLQLAGYYGEFSVSALALPAALPDPCSNDPAIWASAIPVHVQGYDNGSGVPACLPASLKAATDVVSMRRVRTCVAGAAGCDAVVPTEPYLQVALCSNPPVPYRLGIASSTAFTLTAKDCATVAGIRRYVVNLYFISTDNGAGTNVPTLKKLEFNGATFTESALVEGIEQLQIEYGIDTDGDGAPDAYTSDPTTSVFAGCAVNCGTVNWANVVTAKVHVLARTLEKSAGYTDTKTYTLGADASGAPVTVGPFNDGYRRHVYSAAVRLMNPSGRKETP
jgi:type IV pilus assembly protein PilW